MGSDPSFKQETGHLGSFKWGVGNGEQPSGEKLGLCSLLGATRALTSTAKGLMAPCTRATAGPETSQHVLVLRCATARD